ncbi:hypothetical protein CFP66_03140 [Pseudonocardia sp. MH-G8]|nr:hypothetical protein CFP66_03140 [Pseudonocardia sp. MH-G8]
MRAFAHYVNAFPWQWSPAMVDEWLGDLRSLRELKPRACPNPAGRMSPASCTPEQFERWHKRARAAHPRPLPGLRQAADPARPSAHRWCRQTDLPVRALAHPAPRRHHRRRPRANRSQVRHLARPAEVALPRRAHAHHPVRPRVRRRPGQAGSAGSPAEGWDWPSAGRPRSMPGTPRTTSTTASPFARSCCGARTASSPGGSRCLRHSPAGSRIPGSPRASARRSDRRRSRRRDPTTPPGHARSQGTHGS